MGTQAAWSGSGGFDRGLDHGGCQQLGHATADGSLEGWVHGAAACAVPRLTAGTTRERPRIVVGVDHPDTLITANNLAVDLWDVGRVQEASVRGGMTLERRRRVLPEDAPDTRSTASWTESLGKEHKRSGAGE
jgi:hypothetical protein